MNTDVRSESVVYGCIKNVASEDLSQQRRRNRDAMQALPLSATLRLVDRQTFSPTDLCAT